MIITRTPFRISFAGGGSDLADFYEHFGGAVVSATINKFTYLSMHPYFFEDGYLLKYSGTENCRSLEEIRHPILREVFRLYDIHGVDFNSSADIPSGTGLGSSSSFTSGLIHLCNAYNETYLNKEDIAAQACHVEIDLLKSPIGKQDQYACACGGLNFIEFNPDGTVDLEKIYLSTEGYQRLENNLLLFFTGRSRDANTILAEQKRNTRDDGKIARLRKMVGIARELRRELLGNNIDAMGEALRLGWDLKRGLATGITSSGIDECYEAALKAGAEGGKLLGAGGGGFLLFYVKEQNHRRVRQALRGMKELPFKFESKGTVIIHYNKHFLKGIS